MNYIDHLMEMNKWTPTGLIAGFAFGFFLGMFIRDLFSKK